MSDVILAVAVLTVGGLITWLVHLARTQAISARTVRVLAFACAAALLLMLWTDWPSELLADFWAQHSILAGILSTVLLVGIVFLLFEEKEQRTQDRLDTGLTGAGLGGIVDHLVDVEVALALLSHSEPPRQAGWDQWSADGKPLRWLRSGRERLYRAGSDVAETDPRRNPVDLPESSNEWRLHLIDQCVRRLLVALRDWSNLIGVSKNGVVAMLAISELRKDLMKLEGDIKNGSTGEACERISTLRQRARILAYFFEDRSGANPHRLEVLQSMYPLENVSERMQWTVDTASSDLFTGSWNTELTTAVSRLEGEKPHVGSAG